MLDAQDATNVDAKGIPFTVSHSKFSLAVLQLNLKPSLQVRTVFVIDPKKIIRLTISYPAAVGRNFDEVIRIIDALQAGDKYKIATPVNWQPGQDVIVNAAVSNDDAKKLFPDYKSPLVRYIVVRSGGDGLDLGCNILALPPHHC